MSPAFLAFLAFFVRQSASWYWDEIDDKLSTFFCSRKLLRYATSTGERLSLTVLFMKTDSTMDSLSKNTVIGTILLYSSFKFCWSRDAESTPSMHAIHSALNVLQTTYLIFCDCHEMSSIFKLFLVSIKIAYPS